MKLVNEWGASASSQEKQMLFLYAVLVAGNLFNVPTPVPECWGDSVARLAFETSGPTNFSSL